MKKILLLVILSISSIALFAQGPWDRYVSTSGTNTYTATVTVPTFPGSYIGTRLYLKFVSGNTSTATINVNSVGAVALRLWDGDSWEPLVSGDIPANTNCVLTYNAGGNYFEVVKLTGGGAPLTNGNGTTANGTSVDLGGANTANTTFTGNFNWTWASNGLRMGNYRVWSGGTIGLDASTSSFMQVGSNTIGVDASQGQINFGNSRIRVKSDSVMLHTNNLYRLKIDTDGSWDMGGTVPGTSGQVLTSNGSGSGPTWQTLSVGTVTSVGLTTGTSGTDVSVSGSPITSSGSFTLNIPTASASNRGALSSTDWSAFNSKQSAITFGTGVQTALGVNIGSTGAPVLFDGALGTPSSATLTNATGLPISTGVSGLGTGIATWLATPSWTNFSNAITGTAPFWSLASGGTLTGNNNLAGAFSVGLGASPAAKFHVVGLGTTNGELVRFASNTPTTRFSLLDNGQTSWVGSVSGASAIGRSDDITVTATANSQTQTGWDYNFNNSDGAFTSLTRNIAQWRLNGSATPILQIQPAQINTNSINLLAVTFAGDMTIRNQSGALYLRGGSGSTQGLKFGTVFASSTNNNIAFNFTTNTHNISSGSGLTRAFTGILIDNSVSSTLANTITYTGIDYNPDVSSLGGSTLTHYAMLIRSGNVGIRQNTPTAILHLGAGSTAASSAPVKFTSGTLQTTAEAGALEYNGSQYSTKASGLRFGLGGVIFDNFTDANNTGTSETDLYSYTTPASTLANNGEKIIAKYAGTFNDATATAQIKLLFGGTSIFDSGAITISGTGSWAIEVMIIRTGSSTARAIVNMNTPTASTSVYTTQTDVTGLTFTNTNILKITGTAGGVGGGNNDITAKLGSGFWHAAAAN